MNRLMTKHYSLKVGIGASIALKGDERASGSNGGYVTLQHPSTKERRVFTYRGWNRVIVQRQIPLSNS